MGNGQQSVCATRLVDVDGKQAAWIFAEFRSSRTLNQLSTWLDPANWSRWGREMFDSVTLLGERQTSQDPNGEQWHGKYLEVVSIGGGKLHTVLQCDGKRTSNWAAMTYDLDHSVGGVLTVDRGFLSAVDLGNNRRLVKALKIVGFTDTVDNALATSVCPEWTKWMKTATRTAAAQLEGSPVGETHGALGDAEAGDGAAADAAAGFTRGYAREWADYVSDMAQFYGSYATDVGNRMWSGDYRQKDAAEDSSRLFLRLARDWARVWQEGTTMAKEFARSDVPPTGGVPSGNGAWRRLLEYSTVLVPRPSTTVSVAVSDLVRIGTKKATIKAAALKVEPERLGVGSSDPAGVKLSTNTTTLTNGLYEGELRTKGDGDTAVPALFYVSGARPLPKAG